MSLQLQPVELATESGGSESYIVFSDGFLVAVLVRLSGLHQEEAGMWFLETGFGRLSGPEQPPFPSLDVVQAWIMQRSGTERTH